MLNLSTDQLESIVIAVGCIREEYYRLIAQERGLIGATTVLDMIDAALKYEENDE